MAEVVGSRELDIFKNTLYVVYILFLYILLARNQSHSPNLPEGMLENAEEWHLTVEYQLCHWCLPQIGQFRKDLLGSCSI